MRLASVFPLLLAALLPASRTADAGPVESAPDTDVLGELVVDAATNTKSTTLALMRIGIEPVLGATETASRVEAILLRDLDLSGQFKVAQRTTPQAAPSGLNTAAEFTGWTPGVPQAIVRVAVTPDDPDHPALWAAVFRFTDPTTPVFESTIRCPELPTRACTHRLVDKIIGALTDYDGPFSSRLAFVVTDGGRRTVRTIDADGHHLESVSPPEHVATSPAFGPGNVLYWAASIGHGRFGVYRQGEPKPMPLNPRGSVYGLAFSEDRSRAAVSIAVGTGVHLYLGSGELTDLHAAGQLPMALHPAFSARGDIAVAGTVGTRQRIYVGGRPVSPSGTQASSPSYCRTPNGTLLVYAVAKGKSSNIVVADARGRDPVRLTHGEGRNTSPTCSPDGRLIAFFSTRRSGEGPGLYLMRTDGRLAHRISSAIGDSLRWARTLPNRGSRDPAVTTAVLP